MTGRPRRILSLAPTQTENLAALGLLDHLVGVSDHCDHPQAVTRIATFGFCYAPDLPRVIEAAPDLVCTFGNWQEEVRRCIEGAGIRVHHSDPRSVEEALDDLAELARLTECEREGAMLVDHIRERMLRVEDTLGPLTPEARPRVFQIINWEPLITVGPGSFQDDVMHLAGGRNVCSDGPGRYFITQPQAIREHDPQAIIFCEPHIGPSLRRDPAWAEVSAVRAGRFLELDCALACRCGPRIAELVEQLARALHPEKFPG